MSAFPIFQKSDYHLTSPRRHLGTFDGEGKRREPRFQPLDTLSSQLAGLAVTCAVLVVVAFVGRAL